MCGRRARDLYNKEGWCNLDARARALAAYEAALEQARQAAIESVISGLLSEDEKRTLDSAARIIARCREEGMEVSFADGSWQVNLDLPELGAGASAKPTSRRQASTTRVDWPELYRQVVEKGGKMEIRVAGRFLPVKYDGTSWVAGNVRANSPTELGKQLLGVEGFSAPRGLYVTLNNTKVQVKDLVETGGFS